jgi:hypothetical protein
LASDWDLLQWSYLPSQIRNKSFLFFFYNSWLCLISSKFVSGNHFQPYHIIYTTYLPQHYLIRTKVLTSDRQWSLLCKDIHCKTKCLKTLATGTMSAICQHPYKSVCCTFTYTDCSQRLKEKTTYIKNKSYPNHDSAPFQCLFKIKPLKNACWVKFCDFIKFLAQTFICLLDPLTFLKTLTHVMNCPFLLHSLISFNHPFD